MDGQFFSIEREKQYIVLDPRTKLILLVTISTLMLGGGNEGIMAIIRPMLCAVPFLLFLFERRIKPAVKYLVLYLACYALEGMAVNWTSGLLSFLLLAVSSVMTRFAPGILAGAFLLSTTTVSEYIAAMHRMHISDKIVIPLSVIFRFFPTLAEEYHAISDAMRMRGIRLGGRRVFLMAEYRIIPLMCSVIKIGDELSAAALTRGLGAPEKRTNICSIGFHFQDILIIGLCIFCFAAFLLQRYS